MVKKSSSKSSSSLRMVLRVSRIHSKLLSVIPLHPMSSYTCRVSSVQLQLVLHTSAIQPVLCSKCHNIIQVWSTTSKPRMPRFERKEAELASSCLDITDPLFRRRGFSVATVIAQVSAACSITLLTELANCG